MKKTFSSVGVVAAFVVGSGVVLASSGMPEINQVSGTFTVDPIQQLKVGTCQGADGQSYLTESDVWQGTQTDTSTGTEQYSLNGTLTVAARATINQATGAGVSRGQVTLTNSSGVVVYRGDLVLNVQITNQQTLAGVGRGAIDVPFLDSNGNKTGARLIGNEEVTINGPGNAKPLEISGSFGGPSNGTPDLSVETDGMRCATK